ncbi:MAG: hypothetical protein J0H57_23895, partial [Rhodospirillales bacterium]|nr:hypothetical protein [Rhodospirillales bacterium]
MQDFAAATRAPEKGEQGMCAVCLTAASPCIVPGQGIFGRSHRGRGSHVAHECILDLRPIKQRCGID